MSYGCDNGRHIIVAVFTATDRADINKIMQNFMRKDEKYHVRFEPDFSAEPSEKIDQIVGMPGEWMNPCGLFDSWEPACREVYEDIWCFPDYSFKANSIDEWSHSVYPHGLICYSLNDGCFLYATVASAGSYENFDKLFAARLSEAKQKDEVVTLLDCVI